MSLADFRFRACTKCFLKIATAMASQQETMPFIVAISSSGLGFAKSFDSSLQW